MTITNTLTTRSYSNYNSVAQNYFLPFERLEIARMLFPVFLLNVHSQHYKDYTIRVYPASEKFDGRYYSTEHNSLTFQGGILVKA